MYNYTNRYQFSIHHCQNNQEATAKGFFFTWIRDVEGKETV